MKKLILPLLFLGFLTACPSKEEVQQMQDGVSNQKQIAISFLEAKDYSLEGLLKIQNYFFDFSEKVHLIIVEPEARKNMQRMIKKKGGAAEFCTSFILPMIYWESLEAYCSSGAFYKCSPEIREYKNTLEKLKLIIKDETDKDLNSVSQCN